MDFIDNLRQYAALAEKQMPKMKNEEQTKTSLIMPFFSQVLGYDVFDPDEFVPEFTADVGVKKGERVDYAILRDGVPSILVECKNVDNPLDAGSTKDSLHQLFHYFVATPAKFGILTNGVVYKFYTDLEATHKMDLTPFLEVNILSLTDAVVAELKRFTKSTFNADELFGRAEELKYSNAIKTYFAEQLETPSDEFVRLFAQQAYDGRIMSGVIEKFRPLVKTSLNSYISEMMNKRITDALNPKSEPQVVAEIPVEQSEEPAEAVNKITTTKEELEAYGIVKGILYGTIEPNRVAFKDTESYLAVLLDGKVTKWICRLYFNGQKRQLRVPEVEGLEQWYTLTAIDDLYTYRDAIIAAASYRVGK